MAALIEGRSLTAQEEFGCSIYFEHLEEASFLYEQRLSLFDDPEITWLDIEDFEERFEPHIDGLVVGEDLALEVCKQQAREGDFGELHAAVRVFCRQDRKDLVLEVLEELDSEDAESLQAFSAALKYEFPEGWQGDFFQMLPDDELKSIPILADLFGYRRMQAGTAFIKILDDVPVAPLPKVIWALGRIVAKDARSSLVKYLEHEEETICADASLSLLRIGDEPTIGRCLDYLRSQSWPLIPLGLGGSRSAVKALLELAGTDKAEGDCLFALGLLGDISAVDTLLGQLSITDLAEPAATALNLITGAEIYEEAFIPEEIDEDELFEEELEKYKEEGELPTKPDGEPFGITIERLSQNPEDWYRWWAENRSRFEDNIRYRNGKPYSPACLLENLESEQSVHKIRQLAYEELVIRYGVDVPFETDMFVAQQRQALTKIGQWVQSTGNRFQEGTWYFAGQPIP
jgi:uncharacterized protein (TIGR02270 family)